MKIKKSTPLVATDKIDELRAFYCDHFGFKPAFDNGDFLCLESENKTCEISFMKPTCGEVSPHQGMGVTFCFEVDDVDAEHDRLGTMGILIAQTPQDNPWGDRSMIAVDPIGIGVYIYKTIEPTTEFAKFYKE